MATSTHEFLSLLGTYRIDPADADAFAAIAAESVDVTSRKEGCLYYIASQDLLQPGVFHLAEGWSSQAVLDAHLNSADFKAMLEKAMKLRVLDREIYVSKSAGRVRLA